MTIGNCQLYLHQCQIYGWTDGVIVQATTIVIMVFCFNLWWTCLGVSWRFQYVARSHILQWSPCWWRLEAGKSFLTCYSINHCPRGSTILNLALTHM